MKNKNDIAHNFIHGLDGIGGLLGMTVNRMNEGYGVSSIRSTHDEIAVLAADAGVLSTTVREMTCKMFEQDILTNFSDQIQSLLPASVTLPPVPPKGTLDISGVMQSDYYFS
jgi:DNA-directed RNA polymerase